MKAETVGQAQFEPLAFIVQVDRPYRFRQSIKYHPALIFAAEIDKGLSSSPIAFGSPFQVEATTDIADCQVCRCGCRECGFESAAEVPHPLIQNFALARKAVDSPVQLPLTLKG